MKTSFLKITKINHSAFILIYTFTFLLILYKVFSIPITHDEGSTTVTYSNFSIWQIMMYPDAWPNNHILNTVLTKIFLLLFGNDQWVVRLPNLLSFLLYAFGVFRILKTALRSESIFFIPAALLFVANPYLLDFFGLCRGYGMSAALATLSASYLITGFANLNNKNIWIGFFISFLASYANFTLLVFWAASVMLSWFYFFGLFRDKKGSLLKPTFIVIISCLLYAALIAIPIYKMQSTGQFQYWTSSGFYSDTMLPLITHSLYGSRYFLFPPAEIIAFLIIIILVINCVLIFIRFKNSHFRIKSLFHPLCIATAIVVLTAGISIIQGIVLHTPDLNGRTALFFYPLFMIAFVTSLESFSKEKSGFVGKGISILITFVCLIHMAGAINLKSVREWWFDVNTFKVIAYLDKSRNHQNTSLATNWLFNPSFYFYKYTGKTPWLDLKYYNRNLDPNTSATYYYVMAEDYEILKFKFEPVVKFDEGCWLLKKRLNPYQDQTKAGLAKDTESLNALIIETIRKIKEDKKWMALIKEKALKNKITVDSMLYIDARWMIENKGK